MFGGQEVVYEAIESSERKRRPIGGGNREHKPDLHLILARRGLGMQSFQFLEKIRESLLRLSNLRFCSVDALVDLYQPPIGERIVCNNFACDLSQAFRELKQSCDSVLAGDVSTAKKLVGYLGSQGYPDIATKGRKLVEMKSWP